MNKVVQCSVFNKTIQQNCFLTFFVMTGTQFQRDYQHETNIQLRTQRSVLNVCVKCTVKIHTHKIFLVKTKKNLLTMYKN
jgi:hypothetical protein